MFSLLLSDEADLISPAYIILLIEEIKYFKDTKKVIKLRGKENGKKENQRKIKKGYRHGVLSNVLKNNTFHKRYRNAHKNNYKANWTNLNSVHITKLQGLTEPKEQSILKAESF